MGQKIHPPLTSTQTDDVRTWRILQPLGPHIAAVVQHADELEIIDPITRLMNDYGLFLNTKGQFADAEPLMQRHLEIFILFRNKTGYEHPHLQTAINNYASLLIGLEMSEQEMLQ